MAKFRYVQCQFWTDVDIIDNFSPEDRYFYIYLLTNPHTTQCGIYQLSTKQMELETGYNKDTVLILIERFEKKYNKIKYNQDTKEIAIKNWFKYNNSESVNTQKCIEKEFLDVKDKSLIDYVKGLQGGHKGLPYNKKKNKNNKEKEKEIAKNKHLDYVLLTDIEYAKLKTKFGENEANKWIERLNNYIGSKGKKYKSHYMTILNWNNMQEDKNNGKNQQSNASNFKDSGEEIRESGAEKLSNTSTEITIG